MCFSLNECFHRFNNLLIEQSREGDYISYISKEESIKQMCIVEQPRKNNL